MSLGSRANAVAVACGLVTMLAACASPLPSRTSSSSASPSTIPSAAASPSGSPRPTPPQATAYTHWERIVMPDPAPDLYGGGLPSDVVLIPDAGYLAVGTINASCCAGGDPSLNSGVVWTSSRDGRQWEVKAEIPAFQHASLRQVLVVGSAAQVVGFRLFAIGSYAEPVPDGQGVSVPALWTSSDGLNWARVNGMVPDLVARGGPGFIGFSGAFGRSAGRRSPTFMQSTDGMTWKVASGPIVGDVEDLIGTSDGAGLAVGFVEGAPAPDGSYTSDAIAWHSADGLAWTGPTTISAGAGAKSVIAGGPGYLVVGLDAQRAGLWSSADGVAWSRKAIGTTDEESVAHVFNVPGGFLIAGDALWFSKDGFSWGRVPDGSSDLKGGFASLVATADGVLAVGYGADPTPGHVIPLAWLASQ